MNNGLPPEHNRGDSFDVIELQQLLKGPHRILFEGKSPYQDVLLIESKNIRIYLNQQLDVTSLDEGIYHAALVHPGMEISLQHERILILGGENGLALREVFKFDGIKHVSVVPLNHGFLQAVKSLPEMTKLNEGAFYDMRVDVLTNSIEEFLNNTHQPYHVIIMDLPDPVNERISQLYTLETFQKLSNIVTENGLIICQSNSLDESPTIFWSIARTMEESGLDSLSYHVKLPWMGDWGFTLARKGAIPHFSLPEKQITWSQFSPKILSYRNHALVNRKDNKTHLNYDPTRESELEFNNEFKELQHLLAGPHTILYQNNNSNPNVLVLETRDIRLYLDKQLQFSSLDEQFYHEALVHPALTMVPVRNRILVVGGGDGLAIREILKYPDVDHIHLVDLDPLILQVATREPTVVTINKGALLHPIVTIHQQDIRLFIEQYKIPYNVIIVDLPDPADGEIGSLYTVEFFKQLGDLLTDDGILVCQSHSPENAPLVFWSIGLTIQASGFHLQSYHVYVPSFDDWGFHLAGKKPLLLKNKIHASHHTLPEDLSSLFTFPEKIQTLMKQSKVNSLKQLTLHEFYQQAARNNSL
ncbi:MAG TPA: spermidine synthase [Paenibacillaceae bacterium]|nr:spermidine synthase [Paenibacillaceae bacterium]